MPWKKKFIELVRKVYEEERQKDAGLSLRAFAKKIKTPASTISEVINGKLCLNAKRAAEVVEQLPISRNKKNHFLTLLDQPFEVQRDQLRDEDYMVLTDWRYLAILHFFDIENATKTAEAIAQRLALNLDDVHRMVQQLIDRGMLVRHESGELSSTNKNWQTSDGPSSELIQRFHKETLRCAERSLDLIPPSERDFTTTVFAGDPEQMELIKSELRRMHKRVVSIGEGAGPRNRLYSLNVSFYPLDKKEI